MEVQQVSELGKGPSQRERSKQWDISNKQPARVKSQMSGLIQMTRSLGGSGEV